MLTQLRKVQRFLHTCAETTDKSRDHKWREITWGRDIKTISTAEAVQYCRGIAAVLRWNSISTCGEIASVLWRDSISTVEAVQYCGG